MKVIEITSLYQLRGAVEGVSAMKKEIRARGREGWGADGNFGALWDEVHVWEKAIADFVDEVQAINPEDTR